MAYIAHSHTRSGWGLALDDIKIRPPRSIPRLCRACSRWYALRP